MVLRREHQPDGINTRKHVSRIQCEPFGGLLLAAGDMVAVPWAAARGTQGAEVSPNVGVPPHHGAGSEHVNTRKVA